MRVNIIGGGAAGFFAAVNIKEMRPDAEVIIIERGKDVLRKVAVSGGGRCNLTNTFDGIANLAEVYPRGHRLMRKLFHSFGPKEAREWFEKRGVKLVVQPDHCIFPATQESRTVINCLTRGAQAAGVELRTDVKEIDVDGMLGRGEIVVICTGGMSNSEALSWAGIPTEDIERPIPSLFSIAIDDNEMHDLMGTVVKGVTVSFAGTNHKAQGDMLLTHWGVSGPAILRLSSYAARTLADSNYNGTLVINWLGESEERAKGVLEKIATSSPLKSVINAHPQVITSRLWEHIVHHSLGSADQKKWKELGKKEFNKLLQGLVAATSPIKGRAPFKDEFVTAGGVSLSTLNSNTLESKRRPGLYFAGEVIDVDGVTGGFNFTAAWSTAMAVARAVAQKK